MRPDKSCPADERSTVMERGPARVDGDREAVPRAPNMLLTIGRGTLMVLGSVLALPFVRLPKPPPP